MKRDHGLQLPLDPHQIGSWVLFAFLVAGVYALYVPFVDALAARYALLAVYTLLVAVVLCLAFSASVTNPSEGGLSASEGTYFCTICQLSVGRTSKHCKACNRCVVGFDHHCKWLNNCVGARNYRSFFLLVLLTLSMLGLQLGWGIWLFARSFFDWEAMSESVDERYGLDHLNFRGWQATLLLYLLLLSAAVLMLGELLSFHTVLVYKDMTTYDFIMAQRQVHGAAGGGAGGRAPGAADNGARAALCGRSNRVVDAAAPAPAPRKFRASLNPCTACTTVKPEGGPQAWQLAAKPGDIAEAEAPAAGEDPRASAVYPSGFELGAHEGKSDDDAAAAVPSGGEAEARHSAGGGKPLVVPALWNGSASLGGAGGKGDAPGMHAGGGHQGNAGKAAGAVAEATTSSHDEAGERERPMHKRNAVVPAPEGVTRRRSGELKLSAGMGGQHRGAAPAATRTIAHLEIQGS